MAVKEFFDARRAERVAKGVEKVRTALEVTSANQAEKINTLTDAVEEVHLATNSMKDQLVAVTKSEAYAAGIKEERSRSK